MNETTPIEVSIEELEAIVARAERGELEEGDAQLIRAVVEAFIEFSAVLKEKNISISRLRKILFGSKSEKSEEVMKDSEGEQSGADKTGEQEKAEEDEKKPEEEKKKPKGHGRNGSEAYRGAERIRVDHAKLKPGDPCPACPKGKLYEFRRTNPVVKIRLTGNAPVQGKAYELQSLRCNLCLKIYTASMPEGSGDTKYDVSVGSIIAVLKYGSGVPFYRLEKLQESFGVPLPDATQWDIVKEKAIPIQPAIDELVHQAAQGTVIHNDDTIMKVLELMQENKEFAQNPETENRTGMFTTGIISVVGERHIALFYTGRQHAGENLEQLLGHRDPERGPPIHMCDALSRNVTEEFAAILANCMAHARRNFVDVVEYFPQECRVILELLKDVYKNDAIARAQEMTDEQRLIFHQSESGPLMDRLKEWLEKQVADKTVEPNSSMGKAYTYMLKRWKPLTLFLRVPGAPLDNNVCERGLKRAILHRKNSMFYQTLNGAHVGDLYMSIIHTCYLNGVNACDYLTVLEEHADQLAENPEQWMSWNYQERLTDDVEDDGKE